jgi:Tol biopolymer transport system component
MTRDRSVDERISAWLLDEAPEHLPDRAMQATFARTSVSRQRRPYPGWRQLKMVRGTPIAIAVGAAAITIAVVGATLLSRSTAVVGDHSPGLMTPTASAPASSSTQPSAAVSLGEDAAVTRTVDGNTDLYLVTKDGAIDLLTSDPALDGQPSWSPDGKTLLFSRTTSLDPELSEIYALDLATRSETALTTGGGRHAGPVMSPDGTRVAFDQSPTDSGFHVMNADGSNPRLVYPLNSDQWNLGSWISNNAISANRAGVELVKIDVDTGNATTILAAESLGEASLSPDQSTIAFRSERSGGGGVFLMDRDGSNVRKVITTTTKGSIAWTVDGTRLILAQSDGWLYIVGTDGTGLTRWIEATSVASRPTP